jgi:hypothetical protein
MVEPSGPSYFQKLAPPNDEKMPPLRGWIAQIRFKRQTKALVRRIFISYGAKITNGFLDQTWGRDFGPMLQRQATSEIEPEEAACIIYMKTLGVVLQHLSEEDKEQVFFALRNNDYATDASRVSNIANHLRHVVAAVQEIAPNETCRDGVIYLIFGALEGYTGEALEDYMGEQLVNKVRMNIADGR